MEEIITYGLEEAIEEIPKHEGRYGLVSILSPEDETPDFYDERELGHVSLKFHDITWRKKMDMVPPHVSHIKKILANSGDILSHDTIFCHCWAGISRSTAAAIILHYMDMGRDSLAVTKVLNLALEGRIVRPNRCMLHMADLLLDTRLLHWAELGFNYTSEYTGEYTINHGMKEKV